MAFLSTQHTALKIDTELMASSVLDTVYSSSCARPILVSYLAGLLTALIIWFLISTFANERRVAAISAAFILPVWRPVRSVPAKKVDHVKEEKVQVIEVITPRKHFEFRERQWHEPPEAVCVCFEHYDAAQKELKDIGGKDLEWKTTWLDLNMERDMLYQYRRLVSKQKEDETLPTIERAFYGGLDSSLGVDIEDVEEDQTKNDKDHGKNWQDVYIMKRWLGSVQDKLAGVQPRKVEPLAKLTPDEIARRRPGK